MVCLLCTTSLNITHSGGAPNLGGIGCGERVREGIGCGERVSEGKGGNGVR